MKRTILYIMILTLILSGCMRYSSYKYKDSIDNVVLIQIVQADENDRVLYETEDRMMLQEFQSLKCWQRWSDPVNAIKGVSIKIYYKDGNYEIVCMNCSVYFNGKKLRYSRDYFDVDEYNDFISRRIS